MDDRAADTINRFTLVACAWTLFSADIVLFTIIRLLRHASAYSTTYLASPANSRFLDSPRATA